MIAGPLRGNTYEINEGETSIGRVEGNTIVLKSPKVSKRHCLILVQGGAVTLNDTGSSNGTFVNGVLSKSKSIKPGDRISVGEHVLELVKPAAPKTIVAQPRTSKVIPMGLPNNMANNIGQNMGQAMAGMPSLPSMPALPPMAGVGQSPNAATPLGQQPTAKAPADPVEKVKFFFDKYVVNFLFNLNEKQEWNLLLKGLLAVLVLFTVGVSVVPTIDRAQGILLTEARNRARALARLMVDRNTLSVMKRQESEIDITFAEREDRVLSAYIVDMDSRILAPGKLFNQNLSEGQEGRFVQNARKFFEKNERYFSMPFWRADGTVDATYPMLQGNILGLAEPIKILDPSKGKNVIVAYAVVFIDMNGMLFDFETTMVFFGAALVFASIMGLAIYVAIHKLTIRPLTHINEQLDSVLRGDSQSITLPFKMEEIEPFVELLNTAASRMTAGGGGSMLSVDNTEELLNLAHSIAASSSGPMLIMNAELRLHYINSAMEEITGIRADGSVGQDLQTFARDEAFMLMIQDLTSRAPVGSPDGMSDTMEFSGNNYKITASALGSPGSVARGFVITLSGA
jgi:PAS domain-containing protein